MRPYSLVVLLPCLLAALAVGACSNQNEGEPCDPSASDCSNGLTCQTISGVSGPRCCPGDLQLATNPACSNQQAILEASTAPPDSSGDGPSQGEAAAPTTEGSAPVEASSVAPAEAGPDGPSE